jgi:hypothetical protein
VRLAGKRFWTWISVAILSVFVKGGTGTFAQEKAESATPSSTTQFKHHVPPGPNSKTNKVVDKRGTSHTMDATSKEPGKISFKSGFKTESVVGEKRDLKTQSGFKTHTRKAGGDDTPTESSTISKHHGFKKPK